jgi:hypothetical protein
VERQFAAMKVVAIARAKFTATVHPEETFTISVQPDGERQLIFRITRGAATILSGTLEVSEPGQ